MDTVAEENTLGMFLNEKPPNTDQEVFILRNMETANLSKGVHQKSASPKGKFKHHIYHIELS